MKVAYIVDKPNMYGSERHLLDILEHFSTMKDVDTELIAFSEGPMLSNVKTRKYVFNIKWLVNYLNLFSLIQLLRTSSPNLIHCHQPKAVFFGSLIGRVLNIPTVITIHSRAYDHAVVHNNLGKRCVVYIFHKVVAFFSILFATKVVYVNENMFKAAIFKRKSVYLPNWLSQKYTNGKAKDLQYDIKRAVKFVSVGSVTEAKGYDLMLDFFGYLDDNDINYSSIVLGGVDEVFLQKLKKHPNFSDRITFEGFCQSPIPYLTNADFYILFSRSETFGLSYLEAMSQGLPIICLDLVDLRNIVPLGNVLVKDQESAFLSFRSLLCRSTYRDISRKNINRALEFGYQTTMDNLYSLYRGVLQLEK